MEEMICRKATS